MATEDDCSCTDTTEPSNVISLHSDDTWALNSDINVIGTETIDKRDASVLCANADCKYPLDTAPVTSHCVAATTETIPSKPDCRAQQTMNSKSQLPTTCVTSTTKFPPAFSCLCHSHKINGYVLPVKLKEDKAQSRQFWSWFSWKRQRNGHFSKEDKMYEIKLKQTQCPHYSKVRANCMRKQHLDTIREFQPFVYCETPKGTAIKNDKSYEKFVSKSTPREQQTKIKLEREEAMEKIEIYYFDHGNFAYYRTTDCHPVLTTDKCAEKTDQAATRFWAEIFGTIHIGIAFVTAFILQLLRFVLYSVIRPLTVGILQLIADYFVKPLLSTMFNAIVQPVLILLYNIATSLRDLCEPIAEAMGLFLREIANLCAAIRIVEVKHVHAPTTACT